MLKKSRNRLSFIIAFVFAISCNSMSFQAFAESVPISNTQEQTDRNLSSSKFDVSDLTSANLPADIINNENIQLSQVQSLDPVDFDNLDSFTTVNSDGTRTRYAYSTPIKYIDKKTNKIKFINSSIQRLSRTDSNDGLYAFSNTGNSINVYLPNAISSGTLVQTGTYSIKMIPVTQKDASGVSKNYKFLGQSEQVVDYENVYGLGSDLQYTPTNTGEKENIVLKKYTGQNVFQYEISAPGLVPDSDSGNSISLVDDQTGEVVYTFSQPYARDSFTGDDKNYLHITTGDSYTIEQTGDHQYLLSMIISQEFLTNPKTVYPVLIDPTGSIASTGIQTTTCYADNTNNNSIINVGYDTNKRVNARAFVKTTAMNNFKDIDPDLITSAYFQAYNASGNSNQATIYVCAQYDDSSQSPSPVSYYTFQGQSCGQTSTVVNTDNKYYNFDITMYTKQWLNYQLKQGGQSEDYGFGLTSEGATLKKFNSPSSSTNQPSIIINYNTNTSQSDYFIQPGSYYIKNLSSSMYLTMDTGSFSGNKGYNGYNIIQRSLADINSNSYQIWQIKLGTDGLYTISNLYNPTCYLKNGNASGSDYYTEAYQTQGYGGGAEYAILQNGDGSWRFIQETSPSTPNTGYALSLTAQNSSQGTDILSSSYSGAGNQRWTLQPVANFAVGSANYIRTTTPNYKTTQLYLQSSDLTQQTFTGAANQQWTIEQFSDYSYCFKSCSSGLYLAADSGTGTNMTTYRNDPAASWVLTIKSYGAYTLTNVKYPNVVLSDYYLESAKSAINVHETLDWDEWAHSSVLISNLRSLGYPSVSSTTTATASSMITMLENSSIVLTNSHGSATSITITPALGQHSDFSTSDLQSLSNYDALGSEKCVVYLACDCGEGGASVRNMVNITISEGAKCAVGWQGTIWTCFYDDIYSSNKYWADIFSTDLANGQSVYNAITDADSQAYTYDYNNSVDENGNHTHIDDGLRNVYIAGASNITLKN